MTGFEETLINSGSTSAEDVGEFKEWMLKEQEKIQAKWDEIADAQRELDKKKDELEAKEKSSKERLEKNEAYIAKQLKVIEEAYHQLEVDKKIFECERLNFDHERNKYKRQRMSGSGRTSSGVHHHSVSPEAYNGTSFFRGVDSELALRKRYRDLLKIFHPDNKCGDTKTLMTIQSEYDSLRTKFYEG